MTDQIADAQRGNILIVDDTPDNLRLLSRMLKRRGYTVDTAKSGQTALDMVAENQPDIILLDVYMPIMDGYQVCQALKADEQMALIPVVFLSALSEPVDKLRGFEAGGVDYITKPFHFHEVIARVENHLELYRQRVENDRLRLQERAYFDQILHLKDELIYTATHDLKNPLTSIKLSVSLLQRMIQSDDEKVIRHLSKIASDSERMLVLISDVLELARVDAQIDVHTLPVSLPYFFLQQANELSDDAAGANVQIQFSGGRDIQEAHFDAESIGHTIQALLHQLLKRVRSDSKISLSYHVEEEMWLKINVGKIDQLNGYDPAEKEGVWFAFMQAIVEHHNGRLQTGQTHAFHLSLPIKGLHQ